MRGAPYQWPRSQPRKGQGTASGCCGRPAAGGGEGRGQTDRELGLSGRKRSSAWEPCGRAPQAALPRRVRVGADVPAAGSGEASPRGGIPGHQPISALLGLRSSFSGTPVAGYVLAPLSYRSAVTRAGAVPGLSPGSAPPQRPPPARGSPPRLGHPQPCR